MENIFIEYLPPWVETGLQPAFYDKESGTVLQQTARMYAKVIELNKAFNDFSESTADIVNDYIARFTELYNYVHDYFDNLDVQEEINNKLDAMVDAGTLQEIITTYIQSNVAWTFDTVADMKLATNLVAGSYARTLGFHSLNDGGGVTYYITDTGTADEMTVIAVDTLFANIVLPEVVTPEMFGAYGDGTHDDSASWNKAVSVKRDVKAFEKTYLTGKIEVTDNIDIDFGKASFICSDDVLLDIHGEVVTSLANENDYTANDTDYAIVGAGYTSYSGMGFVRGTNNPFPERDYYRGGFACTFTDGKIDAGYPVQVSGTAIDIITPISCNIKNIGDIAHQTTTINTRSIVFTYAKGCNISNITVKDADTYIDINIMKSLNVTMDNINIRHEAEIDNSKITYIVEVEDSCFTTLQNSYLVNKWWHCWTTGSVYLCYRNTVKDSTLLTNEQYAILDHSDTYGTTVTNVTATGICVQGLSLIDGCTILSNKDSHKLCQIMLAPSAHKESAKYTVKNIYFEADPGISNNYLGITIGNYPQITGNTYYVDNLYVQNIKHNRIIQNRLSSNFQATSNYVLGDFVLDNAVMNVAINNNGANVTKTDFNILVMNVQELNQTAHAVFGSDVMVANTLRVDNCYLYELQGTYDYMFLSNFRSQVLIQSKITVNQGIYGSNVYSRIPEAKLLAIPYISIANMEYGPGDTWFNITNEHGSSDKYYLKLNNSTHQFETVNITV